MSDTESRGPRIAIRPNGPYVVSGGVPLVVKRPIETERGEPVGWLKETTLDEGAAYALCRCGGSLRKPFCDGTHATNSFDGSDAEARTGPVKDYAGESMTVHDDRTICEHAGFCGNQATNVWKMMRNTGDANVRSQVIAMVERCPSGALSWSSSDSDGTARRIEPDLPVQVAVIPDGPLWVTGGLPVTASSGQALEARNRLTLCRCGSSSNKPFCDGTHKEVGFQHDPAAPIS
jgi:CDGSH-type Zn-finger protein